MLGHLRSHHHNIPIPPAREGTLPQVDLRLPVANDPGEGRVAAEVKPGVIT
jgi:hypothetical protein